VVVLVARVVVLEEPVTELVLESAHCTKKNLFQKLEVVQGQLGPKPGLRVAESAHCTKKNRSQKLVPHPALKNRFQKLV
jgi:hypothetical protein